MIGPFRAVLIGQQNITTTGKNSKRTGGIGGLSKQTRNNKTHTEGKGQMSQNKQVRKNSATESKKKKNANSSKESKRKTPQTREQNDRGKAHAKGENKRGNTRRENVR